MEKRSWSQISLGVGVTISFTEGPLTVLKDKAQDGEQEPL